MNAITLEATTREVGTKASRALRRTGNVPCVLYGHNVEPVTFQVPELALRPLIYTDEFHQVELIIDGQQWTCMMKDIDFHPVSDRPIHADFQVLKRGEKITVVVPVQLTGTPLGKLEGGIVESYVHELEIECIPRDIPGHIEVDISKLKIGEALYISDITLPGVEFLASEDQLIVSIVAPREEEPEEEEEEIFEEPDEETAD